MNDISIEFMRRIQPLHLYDEIRLGSKFDGGYLVPTRALDTSDVLLSLGYGNDSNFENHFLKLSKRNRVHLFESSISFSSLARRLIASLYAIIIRDHDSVKNHLKNLFLYLRLLSSRKIAYYKRRVVEKPICSIDIGIQEVISLAHDSAKTVLKIDIEGYEYELVNALSRNSFSCLIIEFHEIFSRKVDFVKAIDVLSLNYVISHVHINNFGDIIDGTPNVIEVTLVNKNLVTDEELTRKKQFLPSKFDSPCNPIMGDFWIRF